MSSAVLTLALYLNSHPTIGCEVKLFRHGKWLEFKVDRFSLQYCDVYQSVTNYKKKHSVLSIGCCLDGGQSECELADDCNKGCDLSGNNYWKTLAYQFSLAINLHQFCKKKLRGQKKLKGETD